MVAGIAKLDDDVAAHWKKPWITQKADKEIVQLLIAMNFADGDEREPNHASIAAS